MSDSLKKSKEKDWQDYFDGKRKYPPIHLDEEIARVLRNKYEGHIIRIKNYKGFPYIEIQVFKRITRNVVNRVMIGEEIEGWCIKISTDQVDEYIKALKKCSTLLKKEKRKIERVLDDKPFD